VLIIYLNEETHFHEMHLGELYDLQELLKETEEDSDKLKDKKREIMIKFNEDLEKMLKKFETIYHKHILQDRKLNKKKLLEKEKEIEIVNRSLKTFMPYILLHNLIAYGEME
jgi:hypothetical protein